MLRQEVMGQRKKVFSTRRKKKMEMWRLKKSNIKRSKLRSCFNLHTELFQIFLLPPLEQEKLKDGKPFKDLEL